MIRTCILTLLSRQRNGDAGYQMAMSHAQVSGLRRCAKDSIVSCQWMCHNYYVPGIVMISMYLTSWMEASL